MLDSDQISRIKRAWLECTNNVDSGITLDQFIKIMLEYSRPEDLDTPKSEIVSALMRLFEDIDIDGDNLLTFEELLATIVHMGLGGAEHLSLNPIKQYFEGPVARTHKNSEQTIQFLPGANKVMFTACQQGVVKLAEVANFGKPRKQFDLDRTSVIASEYVDKNAKEEAYDLLVTATTQQLLIWSGASTARLKLQEEILTKHPHTCVKWIPEVDMLFTGTMDGKVHWWKLPLEGEATKNRRDQKAKLVASFGGHTDMITSIDAIPSMDLLLTGSLDTTVRLWDISKRKERLKFSGHAAGVVALAYSDEFRFLLSAGIDHDVCVWSPFADRLVFQLKGHGAPLVGVQFVPGTPQIVTADKEGWIKIWDARNFSCIQTIMSAPNIISYTTTGNEHKRILVSTPSKILAFDQEGSPYSNLIEDEKDAHAMYDAKQLTFVSAGSSMVKVWNALTGKPKKIFREVVQSDISSVCIDDRGRKVFVGSALGNIVGVNLSNGAKVKTLKSHQGEISFLGYNAPDKTVISCGADCVIRIHDDSQIDKAAMLNRIPIVAGPNAELTSLAFSPILRLIATSMNNGVVQVFDMDTGKMQHKFQDQATHQRPAVAFLGQYPIMASSDEYGNIDLYLMRPWSKAKTPVVRFRNTVEDEDEEKSPQTRVEVTCLTYDADGDLLFTGEESGVIKCWEMKAVIEGLGVGKIVLGKERQASNHYQRLYKHCIGTGFKPLSRSSTKTVDIRPKWKLELKGNLISITCGSDPKHIVVVTDEKVLLLDFDGKGIGSLQQQQGPAEMKWKFSPSVQARREHNEFLIAEAEKKLMDEKGMMIKMGQKADSGSMKKYMDSFEDLKRNLKARKEQKGQSPAMVTIRAAAAKLATSPKANEANTESIAKMRKEWRSKNPRSPMSAPALGTPKKGRLKHYTQLRTSGAFSFANETKRVSLTEMSPMERLATSNRVRPQPGELDMDTAVRERLSDAQQAAALNLQDAMSP